MAPQTETVELPTPYQQNDTGDWKFPPGWSDEDIRDWLVTHPEGRPQVETVTIADPDLPPPGAGDYDSVGLDDSDAQRAEIPDRDEYEKKFDEQEAAEAEDYREPTKSEDEWTQEDEIRTLKASGTYAAAIAIPPDLKDQINAENYDPREFILVHEDVFSELVAATHSEAELAEENRSLRKRLNATLRGLRKVQKHWSTTKNELKRVRQAREQDVKNHFQCENELLQGHMKEERRQNIFATRLARRLRKARAGRDKRERQLTQAQATLRVQDRQIEEQYEYINHLERLINGQFN